MGLHFRPARAALPQIMVETLIGFQANYEICNDVKLTLSTEVRCRAYIFPVVKNVPIDVSAHAQ